MPEVVLLKKQNKHNRNNRPKDIHSDEKRKFRQKVYQSSRYKKLRELKRKESPVCEIHDLVGKVRSVEEVHHWQSFCVPDKELSNRLAYDYDNLVSLCSYCHHQIHDAGGYLNGCESLQDVKYRLKYLKETYNLDW